MFKSRQTRTSIGLARGAAKNISLAALVAPGDARFNGSQKRKA
jgi:hypothetical protein